MPKTPTVTEILDTLPPERRQLVDAIRSLIKDAEPGLTENVKWNAPNYVWKEEDRITFRLHKPGVIQLILHMGATRKEDKQGKPVMGDPEGLIEWASDIRGSISFSSLDDVNQHREAVSALIRNWLALS
jgi:hypothetical protein